MTKAANDAPASAHHHGGERKFLSAFLKFENLIPTM